jgi:hypothetical protein
MQNVSKMQCLIDVQNVSRRRCLIDAECDKICI